VLIISLVALLVSINALNVTRRIYTLTSRDYLPELQFEESDHSMTVINSTSDIFTLESIQFIEIARVDYVLSDLSGDYLVLLPLVTNSGQLWVPNGPSREFTFLTDVKPGFTYFESKSKFEFRDPWGGLFEGLWPIDQELYDSIQTRIESEPSGTTNLRLVEIRYVGRFHNMGSVYYKWSDSGLGDLVSAEMISEEEVSKTLSSCITRSSLPETKSFDELWDYLIQTYKIPFVSGMRIGCASRYSGSTNVFLARSARTL
jgi:hypothetical protein